MKKSDLFFIIAVGVLIVAIALVAVFKFFSVNHENFKIPDLDRIVVTDFNGNEIHLNTLLKDDDVTYCLLFDLRDCFSCIYRGLEDLKTLKSNGKSCMGIVIHDYIDEVKGWASNYDFSPFFMLKRADFFEKIKSATTPVFFSFKNGKPYSYRFIVAN